MEGTMSEIRMFAGDFAPKTWAFCAGQLLAVNTNQALFSLLGATYGGDGRNTFALPNLCGRVPVGTGVTDRGINPYNLGQADGTNAVTVLAQNMPAHNHNMATNGIYLSAYSETGDVDSPSGAYLASIDGLYSHQPADTFLGKVDCNVAVGVTGGSQPMPIQQPYLGMNYIICLTGLYPTRP
ncbi:MAG: phage tail protein [Flavobacterium sp.]|jgi:microcystin-dependent protein|nr:MAG: phage tail protein [Flavobacterium sp.]